MKVPTNVETLFTKPCRPISRFVATVINEMLDIIRNVTPPFLDANWLTQSINPSSKTDLSGKNMPPFIAKLTELNNPPIMKKNKKILIIPRFIGLRTSDGLIARSVIFRPKTKPTAAVGRYIISTKKGDSEVSCLIRGANIKKSKIASPAALPKSIKFSIEWLRLS
jgi:hypothetical protein